MANYRPSNTASPIRIAIVVAILLALLIAFGIGYKTTLKVNNITYKSESIPEGFNNYKIVHISDIHGSSKGFSGRVRGLKPDLIVITGDIADGEVSNSLGKQLSDLASICDVYYVSGESDTVDYSEYGIVCLDDTSIVIEAPDITVEDYIELYHSKDELSDEELDQINQIVDLSNNQYMQLIGLGNTSKDTVKSKVDKSIQISNNCLAVCLMHHSEYFDSIKNLGLSLVLSGHSHGTMKYSDKYYTGSYSENGTTMFISSGIGNVADVPRGIMGRSEISVITLNNSTAHSKNLLEVALDKLITDVGGSFNDDKIEEYTYSFKSGEEK